VRVRVYGGERVCVFMCAHIIFEIYALGHTKNSVKCVNMRYWFVNFRYWFVKIIYWFVDVRF